MTGSADHITAESKIRSRGAGGARCQNEVDVKAAFESPSETNCRYINQKARCHKQILRIDLDINVRKSGKRILVTDGTLCTWYPVVHTCTPISIDTVYRTGYHLG